jgi:large subunit ribosomal protein L35e
LLKDLQSLKQELLNARTSATSSTSSNTLSQVRSIKKSIARVLTVYNEKRRTEAKLIYSGKKYLPKDLRLKATRAMRRRLTPEQKNKNTVK